MTEFENKWEDRIWIDCGLGLEQLLIFDFAGRKILPSSERRSCEHLPIDIMKQSLPALRQVLHWYHKNQGVRKLWASDLQAESISSQEERNSSVSPCQIPSLTLWIRDRINQPDSWNFCVSQVSYYLREFCAMNIHTHMCMVKGKLVN